MPSGKQSRRARQEAARKPPPVKGARLRGQASPRVLLGAAGALLAIGAIIAVVIVVTGSSDSKPPGPLPGAADVKRLFANIPQADNRLGNPGAPVTMVEYVDLQCPFCKTFEEEQLPGLISKYVRPGDLQIQARPLAFLGPDSTNGQLGAIAAGEQNRMFDFMQILYLNQGAENSGWLSTDTVDSAAVSIGLDLPQFHAAYDSDDAKSQAASVASQAAADGVEGTPTVLVGRTGGTLTLTPIARLDAAIDRLLE
jgi:protein-disulfide isomerase